MYSWLGRGVNAAALVAVLLRAVPGAAQAAPDRTEAPRLAGAQCDPAYAGLFTPPQPRLGRYETCVVDAPLERVAPEGWAAEPVDPVDAFGAAGLYDRSRLERLYAGRRPMVARGWVESHGRFESWTLVSPYPDPTLTTLRPGTLAIRYLIRP